MKVAIVDYGLGNLFSINQACLHVGLESTITADFAQIEAADAVILPGVGAFGDAMNYLNTTGLIQPIQNFVQSGKPFMGICLGMQLMFSESEEFGTHKGLNLLQGKIVRFPETDGSGNKVKVPQIQWNEITKNTDEAWNNSPLKGIPEHTFMHFVHSYYSLPDHKDDILTYSEYADIQYASAVKHKNILGFQYHPEKSGALGLKIYENWAKSI